MLFASAMKVAGLLSLCVGLTALTPANAENHAARLARFVRNPV